MSYLLFILATGFLATGGFGLDYAFRTQQRLLFQLAGIAMFLGVAAVIGLIVYFDTDLLVVFLLLSLPTSVGYITSGVLTQKS